MEIKLQKDEEEEVETEDKNRLKQLTVPIFTGAGVVERILRNSTNSLSRNAGAASHYATTSKKRSGCAGSFQ